MLIGYARVSTHEQNLDLQRDALKKAGVSSKNLYTDKITGTKAERPGLEQALSHLREGDTLVVWRLDRLGRSLTHLIETVTALKQQHIAFQSITENINTATATGQLVFHLFGALAEFERNLITERTMAAYKRQEPGAEKAEGQSSTRRLRRLSWQKSSMRITPTLLLIFVGHSISRGQRSTGTSRQNDLWGARQESMRGGNHVRQHDNNMPASQEGQREELLVGTTAGSGW